MMQVRRSVPKIWFKHGQGTPGEFTHHEEKKQGLIQTNMRLQPTLTNKNPCDFRSKNGGRSKQTTRWWF